MYFCSMIDCVYSQSLHTGLCKQPVSPHKIVYTANLFTHDCVYSQSLESRLCIQPTSPHTIVYTASLSTQDCVYTASSPHSFEYTVSFSKQDFVNNQPLQTRLCIQSVSLHTIRYSQSLYTRLCTVVSPNKITYRTATAMQQHTQESQELPVSSGPRPG